MIMAVDFEDPTGDREAIRGTTEVQQLGSWVRVPVVWFV